jgi:hypothetical protein
MISASSSSSSFKVADNVAVGLDAAVLLTGTICSFSLDGYTTWSFYIRTVTGKTTYCHLIHL